jgi:hypothetical protein
MCSRVIKDRTVKAELQQQWATVRALSQWSRGSVVGGGFGAVFINETPPESFYNLPLVLAYSALDHALTQFIVEGVFPCTNRKGHPCFNLGEKMKAAKNAPGLSWIDFDSVEKGRVARNDLAHRAKLASKNECRAFIEAVEVEFRHWGLIS